MPANLPPQYHEIERKFREAKSTPEKLACLREMLSVIPKHKGTEKLQGDLKRRISKLQSQLQKSRKLGRRPYGFSVQREGAAQVVLVGPANSGKSSLVKALTRADAEVAQYPFTTTKPMPGMMQFEDIQIQLVDTPPVMPGSLEQWYVQLVMNADALLLVLDVVSPSVLEELEMVRVQLASHKVALGSGAEPEPAPDEERLRLKKALVVGNKIDLEPPREAVELVQELLGETARLFPFSTVGGDLADSLKRAIFELLDLVRVYTKVPGKKPDLDRPFVLRGGSTVLEVAALVHKDFEANLKSARIWGSGAFDGQYVQRDHVVKDKDVIELHL
ncbi:MAG: 50S ribosome-binding GTPase [Candidatus Eiseniibacteriota bacterium]|nr:MAG: 50S ribosome-binding GTPase [Candidatus Eisenbacteria bacterium]